MRITEEAKHFVCLRLGKFIFSVGLCTELCVMMENVGKLLIMFKVTFIDGGYWGCPVNKHDGRVINFPV